MSENTIYSDISLISEPGSEFFEQGYEWSILKEQVNASGHLLPYKKVYLLALIKYGKELGECGIKIPAQSLYNKVEGSLNKGGGAPNKCPTINTINTVDFDQSWGKRFNEDLIDAFNLLEKYKAVIPDEEYNYYETSLKEMKGDNDNGTYSSKSGWAFTIQEQFRELRDDMLRCICRCLNYKGIAGLEHGEINEDIVGPYNAKENLRSLFSYLNDKDPDWVRDIVDYFEDLNNLRELFANH